MFLLGRFLERLMTVGTLTVVDHGGAAHEFKGAPGPRGDHGLYGGYFRDLDGNKLNAHVRGE